MKKQTKKKSRRNRSAPVSGEILVSATRAADLLSISERKLWELTNRAEIPSVRIDRCLRYRVVDLAAWVEQLGPKQE